MNKQTRTLKHKMTFKDRSFIFVLNSSHYGSLFTSKSKGRSDIVKFKGLRVTDALRWIARFNEGSCRAV